MVWQGHICVNPEIAMGKPVIKGSRIPVYMVLELIEADIAIRDIIVDYYPSLSVDDVRACIQYATHLVKNEEIHFVYSPLTPAIS